MNLWDVLFTTQPTEPPKFDLLWYGSLFTLLAVTVFLAYRYRNNTICQRFFQILLKGSNSMNLAKLVESLQED